MYAHSHRAPPWQFTQGVAGAIDAGLQRGFDTLRCGTTDG
jgi:hypothetical protein